MAMMALNCWDGNWDGHYGTGMLTGRGTIEPGLDDVELGWIARNWGGNWELHHGTALHGGGGQWSSVRSSPLV